MMSLQEKTYFLDPTLPYFIPKTRITPAGFFAHSFSSNVRCLQVRDTEGKRRRVFFESTQSVPPYCARAENKWKNILELQNETDEAYCTLHTDVSIQVAHVTIENNLTKIEKRFTLGVGNVLTKEKYFETLNEPTGICDIEGILFITSVIFTLGSEKIALLARQAEGMDLKEKRLVRNQLRG